MPFVVDVVSWSCGWSLSGEMRKDARVRWRGGRFNLFRQVSKDGSTPDLCTAESSLTVI